MSVNLIYAQSRNRYIGKDNKLLFNIPEDIKRFKILTQEHIVIMGRNTWDSLPDKFRPLPKRHNIVITSKPNLLPHGVKTYTSLKEAIDTNKADGRDIWLIGGERIYSEGIEYADKIFQTVISVDMQGDTRAPYIDNEIWKIEKLTPLKSYETFSYQFITYVRKSNHDQPKET